MTEISSIGGEVEFSAVPEALFIAEAVSFETTPSPVSLGALTPQMDIKQKIASQDLQIQHCKEFVARHCNHNTQVMTVLDKAISSWQDRKIPIDRLLAAVEFAADKHQFQTRKNHEKTPYIIHPICVAQLTLELGELEDTDALIAALLHDTIEDTDTTPEEVERLFGKHVLDLVLDLTKPPELSGEASKAAQIAHAPHMYDQAKVIKLADRLYNMCDTANTDWEPKRVDNYILWGAKLAQVLRGTNCPLEQAIEDKVNSHFQERYPSKYVDRLASKWQFPSDHLPIGASVNGIEMASWNVLNDAYMHWVVEEDTQGLKGSLLSDANYVVDPTTGLTRRDELVIEKIMGMINHPSHPKELIGLQECGPAFLNALEQALPEHIKIVYTADHPFPKDQNVVLYDARVLNHREDLKQTDYPYLCEPKRDVMNLTFEKEGKSFRLFNAHLPGDPSLPGRSEFAAHVNAFEDDIVVALGDMNFKREEMQEAFLTQGGENLPFTLISSYPTDVGLSFHSKTIDHIYVKGTFDWTMRYPEEVMERLTPTVDLLID